MPISALYVIDELQVLYRSTVESVVLDTCNRWFVEVVQSSIKQVRQARAPVCFYAVHYCH